VRRQLEPFTAGLIVGRLTEAQVDEIILESGVDQCADYLWESERAGLPAGEALEGVVLGIHRLVTFKFGGLSLDEDLRSGTTSARARRGNMRNGNNSTWYHFRPPRDHESGVL
jgi:hypothetical protein